MADQYKTYTHTHSYSIYADACTNARAPNVWDPADNRTVCLFVFFFVHEAIISCVLDRPVDCFCFCFFLALSTWPNPDDLLRVRSFHSISNTNIGSNRNQSNCGNANKTNKKTQNINIFINDYSKPLNISFLSFFALAMYWFKSKINRIQFLCRLINVPVMWYIDVDRKAKEKFKSACRRYRTSSVCQWIYVMWFGERRSYIDQSTVALSAMS